MKYKTFLSPARMSIASIHMQGVVYALTTDRSTAGATSCFFQMQHLPSKTLRFLSALQVE